MTSHEALAKSAECNLVGYSLPLAAVFVTRECLDLFPRWCQIEVLEISFASDSLPPAIPIEDLNEWKRQLAGKIKDLNCLQICFKHNHFPCRSKGKNSIGLLLPFPGTHMLECGEVHNSIILGR